MKRILVGLLLATVSVTSFSVVDTPDTKITSVVTYSNYGDADVVIYVENSNPACDGGFWFNKSDKGYSSNLSVALAAYQAKNSVVIHGHEESLWGGTSSSKFCRVYAIQVK